MNTMIISSKTEKAISSIELVEIINAMREEGKATLRHDTFLRKIEKVLESTHQNFVASYKDATGRALKCYALPKREASLMVMSESYEVQAKVYDRMVELEGISSAPLQLSTLEILAMAMESEKARLVLVEKIASDAPKVAFAETIRAIDGVCHIEKIAKTLGFGRNKFFKQLREDSILMGNNLPYQKYIDREYFTVVEQEPYTDKEGVKHPTFTAMVTGAGQVFLARKYTDAGRLAA